MQGGLADCLALSQPADGLESATVTATGTGTSTGCVLATSTGHGRFVWNTGQTSKFTYEFNLNPLDLGAGVWLSFTVTHGPLAGSTADSLFLPYSTGNCLTGMTGFGVVGGTLLFLET